MPVSRVLLATGLVTAAACGPSWAADLQAPNAEAVQAEAPIGQPSWSFTAGAYLWAAGVQGDVGQFGLPPVTVDASFSDIFDNLDFAATAVGEIRYGDFGLFNDFKRIQWPIQSLVV
jgi:hypothetical protein